MRTILIGMLRRFALGAGVGMLVLVGLFWLQGGRILSVQTSSMSPTIRPADAVIVQHAHERDLRVGTIVTYKSSVEPGILVSHRIVALHKADQKLVSITTRGDNLRAEDTPIAPSAIVGKEIMHIAYVGAVLDALRKPLGLVAAVYVPALFVVRSEIQRLARYYAGKRYSLYGYV